MAVNVPCLLNRNGCFYFRYIIPVPHKKVFGINEFVHSLRTKEYSKAKILCWKLYNMTTQLTQELLSNPNFGSFHQIEPPKAKAVAVDYFRQTIKAMIKQFHTADIFLIITLS